MKKLFGKEVQGGSLGDFIGSPIGTLAVVICSILTTRIGGGKSPVDESAETIQDNKK